MSDVERIVNANFDRIQWAHEVEMVELSEREAERVELPKKAGKKRNESKFQAIHTAVLACAMFTGAGAAFAGLGLSSGDALTIGVGLLVMAVFIGTGVRLDAWARTV